MKKELSEREQIAECRDKIIAILKEYNARIDYDKEIVEVLVVDQDTLFFEGIY